MSSSGKDLPAGCITAGSSGSGLYNLNGYNGNQNLVFGQQAGEVNNTNQFNGELVVSGDSVFNGKVYIGDKDITDIICDIVAGMLDLDNVDKNEMLAKVIANRNLTAVAKRHKDVTDEDLEALDKLDEL